MAGSFWPIFKARTTNEGAKTEDHSQRGRKGYKDAGRKILLCGLRAVKSFSCSFLRIFSMSPMLDCLAPDLSGN
jgi:hypothetical protein